MGVFKDSLENDFRRLKSIKGEAKPRAYIVAAKGTGGLEERRYSPVWHSGSAYLMMNPLQ